MIKEEIIYAGIPLWLLREYLEELGGKPKQKTALPEMAGMQALSKSNPIELAHYVSDVCN
jgi:hypothetical protein